MNLLSSLFTACVLTAGSSLLAADFSLRPNDVVALVGGEDLAAAGECSYLELLLVRALPQHKLKVRNLAWEGDTVYQQSRDLNYPSLEQQLDDTGATVVLAQFGQMESLGGQARLAEFAAAYEKLIERLSAGGKRRIVLIGPTPVLPGTPAAPRFASLGAYNDVISGIAQRRQLPVLLPVEGLDLQPASYRDGLHLSDQGQRALAVRIARTLGVNAQLPEITAAEERRLVELIRTKNQYWFHYARPQNWAFLHGDRTVQPSSRDHLNPEKRWFPEEMKQWLPLIEKKEEEIWDFAARHGGPR